MPAFTLMELVVDLRDTDRFWNMADPGWAYGLYYAIVGPLLLGGTTHFCEAGEPLNTEVVTWVERPLAALTTEQPRALSDAAFQLQEP